MKPHEVMQTFPLCFASVADFERWRKSFQQNHERARCITHCRDCLPAYQLRMKKLGRCEHPETMFSITEDGEIIGSSA